MAARRTTFHLKVDDSRDPSCDAARVPASKVSDAANQVRLDFDQVHLGPLINRKQCDRIHGIVQDTLRAGARALTGASAAFMVNNLVHETLWVRGMGKEE